MVSDTYRCETLVVLGSDQNFLGFVADSYEIDERGLAKYVHTIASLEQRFS